MELRRNGAVALSMLYLSCVSIGCSSSEGYVDYASIPGPAATEVDSDTESDVAVPESESVNPDASALESASGSIVEPLEKASSAKIDDVDQAAEPKPVEPEPTGKDDQPLAPAAAAMKAEPKPAVAPDTRKMDSKVAPGTPEPATANPASDSATADASVDPETPAEPKEIKLLISEKRFTSEGDLESLRISYDDIDLLKVLNMEPVPVDAVKHFPDWLKELDGKRVRLRGFMFPTFIAEGIQNFGFARDNGICCFVRQPKIYDMIEVSLADDETTDYIDGKPFDVEGVFRIDPDADDVELFQLYRIEDAKVLK